MRRLFVANLLVFAVLASAAALAYYGWSYTAEVSSRERMQIEDTMRELADEKIAAIESQLVEADRKVFAAIDIGRLPEVAAEIDRAKAPIVNVFLLDADLQPIPSGYFSKTPDAAEATAFRDRFLSTILPTLPLRVLQLQERGHVHGTWDGQQHLFAFTRKRGPVRDYYIVVETDLAHLTFSVFDQFFVRGSPRLYQVVDENGELIYGEPFRGTEGVEVELPFVETVDKWRLRVAQRDAGSQTARGRRKLIDIVLIGVALAGIVAGLTILLVASRRERRANELKSEFITNVSHELKTPLSIISMFGEMLALGRTRSAEQATEYAEIIWRESVRLARLIDNVLDFAKIERGKDVYEFAEGDVAEVVGRALELSAHRLQKAELEVEVEIDPELPLTLIDANAYTLAVLNLIDNAIKYAAEGKKIIVRVRHDRARDRIVLEVRDFGPGIEAEEHARIFERFYRARAVRLKPIRGSGIGLALVEHIAGAHGGGVGLTSKVGEGTTFSVWIPVRAEPGGAGGERSVV